MKRVIFIGLILCNCLLYAERLILNLDSKKDSNMLLAISDVEGENTEVVLDSIPTALDSKDSKDSKNAKIGDNGFYVINKMGYKFNYLGFSYSLMGYYKKKLFTNSNSILFKSAEVNAGGEFQITSYTRVGGYVDIQPFSFLGAVIYVGYEGAWTSLGRPVLIDADREYAHAVTGGPASNREKVLVGGSTLVTQIMPYLTFGGKVTKGGDMLAFVYRPTITMYHAFNAPLDSLMYYSGDNVVVRAKGDVHYAHDVMLMYLMEDLGLKVGAVGTIEHIASYKGLWRYGVFGLVIYNKPLKKWSNLEPFIAAKVGTWLEDKYFQYNFTVLGELGLRWKL